GRFGKSAVTELREAHATKAAVRQQLPRHAYLHLATHGFFAPPELRSALATRSGDSYERIEAFGKRDGVGWHPGVLSGLGLAGATHPPGEGQQGGILTALELAELDLGGVDMAVMSACETGLGATAGGESLLGLQRAFQVAGVRTTVASLWSVD